MELQQISNIALLLLQPAPTATYVSIGRCQSVNSGWNGLRVRLWVIALNPGHHDSLRIQLNPNTSSYAESSDLVWEVLMQPDHKWFILWPGLKSKSDLSTLFTSYGALYFRFISGHY